MVNTRSGKIGQTTAGQSSGAARQGSGVRKARNRAAVVKKSSSSPSNDPRSIAAAAAAAHEVISISSDSTDAGSIASDPSDVEFVSSPSEDGRSTIPDSNDARSIISESNDARSVASDSSDVEFASSPSIDAGFIAEDPSDAITISSDSTNASYHTPTNDNIRTTTINIIVAPGDPRARFDEPSRVVCEINPRQRLWTTELENEVSGRLNHMWRLKEEKIESLEREIAGYKHWWLCEKTSRAGGASGLSDGLSRWEDEFWRGRGDWVPDEQEMNWLEGWRLKSEAMARGHGELFISSVGKLAERMMLI